MRHHRSVLLAALTVLALARLPAASVPGTTLVDETVDVTLVVATTGRDDTGTGTATNPYRTIAKGLAQARTLGQPLVWSGNTPGPNPNAKRVKVLVKAGVYREGDISSEIWQDSVKTLVLAGEVDANGQPATTLSGFKVWDDDAWTNNGNGTWTHAWTADYGVASWPTSFQPLPAGNQLAQRREIILVGNRLLEQRMDAARLGPECFAVDEAANTITVRTAGDPNAAVVEVGSFRSLLTLRRNSNLVVRNLRFEGAAGHLWTDNYDAALQIGSYGNAAWVENVLVENCRFEWNGGSGLTTNMVSKMTVRDCVMSDNGGTGVSFGGSSLVRFENSTIARNWWRGLWGRQGGDVDAGSKNCDLYHALFRNLTVEGNLTRGLWFDVYCKDVTVEACTIAGNWGGGVYFEISQPGSVVRDCVIRDNWSSGIHLNASRQVSITGNTIANNVDGAIQVSVGGRTDGTVDRDTGAWVGIGSVQDVTITGNALTSWSYREPLISHPADPTYVPPFISTLTCDRNAYRQDAALARKGFGSGIAFAAWRGQVGRGGVALDAGSTCADPLQSAPAADGGLEIEWYEGAGGRDPSTAAALNLANDARYLAKAPLYRTAPAVFEGQPDAAGNSARVARGWIVAPVSGQYRFWIAGGQQVRLRLSGTDRDDGAGFAAATGGGGSLAREWDAVPGQATTTRTLAAGGRYWFELVQTTDSTGGTAPRSQPLALAWAPPADGVRRHAREVVPRRFVAAKPDGTLGAGTARREGWLWTYGSDIWQLTGSASNPRPDYPNAWMVRQELSRLELGRNWAINAGSRVRANLVPTVGGSYTFWVASRGRSELWLTTAAGRAKIAEVTGTGTSYRTWNTQASQKSQPIALAAGSSYAIELIHKCDGDPAEDHASVAWSTNAFDAAPAIIGAADLRSISAPVAQPPVATTPVVTIAATDATAGEPSDGGAFTVTRSVVTAAPLTVALSVGGSASAGGDYGALAGSVTIAANQASATIAVAPIDDAAVESAETVVVAVASGSGYGVGSAASATVTIADNDGTVPAPWTARSIGNVGVVGSAGYAAATGTWTVSGAGADIWGTADAFQAVGQPISGDVTIVARVAGLTATDVWAKAGVMIRAGTAADAAHAFLCATPGNGVSFQYRTATGGASSLTSGGAVAAPVWVRLVRVGSLVTASQSATGSGWTTVGSVQIPLGSPAQVMLAVTAHNPSLLCTATFTNVSVTQPAGGLPSPWTATSVGWTGLAGSAGYAGATDTWTVAGAGADIWGNSDGFQAVAQPVGGDVTVTARVASVTNTDAWAKAGVMIRSGTAPDAAYAYLCATPGNGVSFQYRTANGAYASLTAGGAATVPVWVRLARVGATVTASQSATGSSWTTIGSVQIALGSTPQVMLAVTAHNPSLLCTATFTNVSVSQPAAAGGLPVPWAAASVGATGLAGSVGYAGASDTWTIAGAGADIWGTVDAFQAVSQPVSGNVTVVARVTGLTYTDSWAKAGIMIRGSLAADAPHAFLCASAANGIAFQSRASTGASSSHTPGGTAGAPMWLRLVRNGGTVTAAQSPDGSSWTTIGSTSVAFDATVQVLLAVTAHTPSQLCTATFTNVSVMPSGGG